MSCNIIYMKEEFNPEYIQGSVMQFYFTYVPKNNLLW